MLLIWEAERGLLLSAPGTAHGASSPNASASPNGTLLP